MSGSTPYLFSADILRLIHSSAAFNKSVPFGPGPPLRFSVLNFNSKPSPNVQRRTYAFTSAKVVGCVIILFVRSSATHPSLFTNNSTSLKLDASWCLATGCPLYPSIAHTNSPRTSTDSPLTAPRSECLSNVWEAVYSIVYLYIASHHCWCSLYIFSESRPFAESESTLSVGTAMPMSALELGLESGNHITPLDPNPTMGMHITMLAKPQVQSWIDELQSENTY